MTDFIPHFFRKIRYDQCNMRFECETHSGRLLGFHGMPDTMLPNGWPLVSIEAQLSRTNETRPEEFYDLSPE